MTTTESGAARSKGETVFGPPQLAPTRRPRSIIVYMCYFWLGLIVFLAAFATLLPISTYSIPVGPPRQTPSFESLDMLLGTDNLGRSILSRCIHGARVSLLIGLIAGLAGFVIGTTLGLISGYFGGLADRIIMLLTDSLLAFPPLILLLALASVLKPSVTTIMIGLTLLVVPTFIRLSRANTMAWGSREFNALQSGGIDGFLETNWLTLDKAEKANKDVALLEANGGQFIAMNSRKAPFDDVRARQALAMAINRDSINDAAYQGTGLVPDRLFRESSPFFSDIELNTYDPEKAQELFDELAAEGKPVNFTFKSFPTAENQAVAQSVQTQLATFKNVKAEVQVIDFAESASVYGTYDYDMIVSTANFIDPDPQLFFSFHSESRSNASAINDSELDAALQAGRIATDVSERTAAYKTVQERLAELVPGIWYVRAAPSFVSNDNLQGVTMYGMGSLLPEELWNTK